MPGRFVRNAAAVAVAAVCSLVLFPVTSRAQHPAFTYEVSASAGDRVAGGGRFLRGSGSSGDIAGTRALNNRGESLVVGDVSGDCQSGMYLISGGKISPLADYHCNPSPLGPFAALRTGSINDNGQALIVGRAGPANQVVGALFLSVGGKLTKIAAEGDTTPTGTVFSSFLLRPFPSPPTINNQGKVAFLATCKDSAGNMSDGAFLFDGTRISKIIVDGDASPLGGTISLDSPFDQSPRINDLGQILFFGRTANNPDKNYSYGYFLQSVDGTTKVVETLDNLPDNKIMIGIIGSADVSNTGAVVFPAEAGSLVGDKSAIGIYLYSDAGIQRIAFDGDGTPIGGVFAFDPNVEDLAPRINDRGLVAFLAPISGVSASRGLFLASQTAMVEVAAVGDTVPSGDQIASISSFSFNNKSQVAFFANGKKKPLGAFLAVPARPKIQNVHLRTIAGGLELTVGGTAMIANDAVIEIDGTALGTLTYPQSDRQTGGTSATVVSTDSRLDQLLPTGHAVQVTIFNSLTNQRSKPRSFTR